ncbi:MAG: hypothetical protein OEW84_01855 [Aigarchaeota archaeon]|nr:hypothetical protein [Aigarchaeota archaeon]
MERRRISPFGVVLVLVAVFAVVVALSGVYVYLDWTVLETMYSNKAGIDWFETVFYHNMLFIVSGVAALVLVNPIPGHSDLFATIRSVIDLFYRQQYGGEAWEFPVKPSKVLWVFWQFAKWMVGFAAFTAMGTVPFLGNASMMVLMMSSGLGSWSSVSRIFALPLVPASGSELVQLIPTMEIQYRLLEGSLTLVAAILAVRFFLRMVKNFVSGRGNVWARDLFVILSSIVFAVMVSAPYWRMDATTPFDFLIVAIVFAVFLFGSVAIQLGVRGRQISFARGRRTALIIVAAVLGLALIANGLIVVWYRANWNNNWTEYEWQPQSMKQIAVTRWTAGLDGVRTTSIMDLPEGNVSTILSRVRQWDYEAAYTRMKNQIGVNWMDLADAGIVYINGGEYWVAPTTILYPATDWISQQLIYTHSSRIIAIDSHTGDFVPVPKAFGVSHEPLIYYGEGFRQDVYVHVKGFEEIGNASYPGQPDYVLSGWQRGLWFLREGQLGFAFTPPQESVDMLHERDIFHRVQSILIDGLTVDPAAYLVTDGQKIYYLVQVFIDYPLQTGFSLSNYLRFFAVVLVDPETGVMRGYFVGKPDGFLADFYRSYYGSWGAAPAWLVPQLRYPEELLGIHSWPYGQLDVDFFVHVSDPFVWRSGSQFYERPPATEVLYIVGAVGNKVNFLGLQLVEFLQSAGKNLAGMYFAYGGERLGEIDLYEAQVQTNATNQLIGPSAALQAIQTDSYVKQQMTLLPGARTGNILLYVIGGRLYYFIPVYTTTGAAGGVITKMPFIAVLDATNGTMVATAADSVAAYYALVGVAPPITEGYQERLAEINGEFKTSGLPLVNVTSVSANVNIEVNSVRYVESVDWNSAKNAIDDFVTNYALKYGASEIYSWQPSNSTISFGVLAPQAGVVKLYFLSITYR